MTTERKQEIKTELERRLNKWLKNETFEEMTCMGSFIRFEMALGMIGYPFEKREWMEEKDCIKFVTEEEFSSDEFTDLERELFNLHINQLA